MRENIVLCLLPAAFYLAKICFFQPYGSFEGYNEIIFAKGAPFLQTVRFFFYYFFISLANELKPLLAAALYLPVRQFAQLKARRRDISWLKYL